MPHIRVGARHTGVYPRRLGTKYRSSHCGRNDPGNRGRFSGQLLVGAGGNSAHEKAFHSIDGDIHRVDSRSTSLSTLSSPSQSFSHALLRHLLIGRLAQNPFSVLVAIKMQNNTSSHWRGCFYWMIGVNAVSTLCYYLFYHPPTFKMLYRTKTLRKILADFDYIGLLLFSLGLLLLVMGMQWGACRLEIPHRD